MDIIAFLCSYHFLCISCAVVLVRARTCQIYSNKICHCGISHASNLEKTAALSEKAAGSKMPPRKRKEKVATEAATTSEPSSMKVAELREELEKRGLDTSGRKAELVSRLEAALMSSTGPSPTKKTKSDEEEEDGIDFDKLRVAELQDELAKRGLGTSGRKGELVSRLKAASAPQTLGQSEAAGTGAGKLEEEEAVALEEETDFSKAVKALKRVEKEESKGKGGGTRTPKVDAHVPMAGCYAVVDDWDCTLNQTNIGQNNNKYYVIQLLQRSGGYSVWTRWGRVGEPGQHALKKFGSMDSASREFCKKFRDKTRNAWEERGNFQAVPGKYTLIEMDADDELEEVRTRAFLLNLTHTSPTL